MSIYSAPRTAALADFLGYSNIFSLEQVRAEGTGAAGRLAGSGHRLFAAAVPEGGLGQALSACVRPDHVRIAPLDPGEDAAAPGCANTLTGEVILASYMGSHMQYIVKTAEGQNWEVICNRIDTGLRPRMQARLTVEPVHVQFLPDGDPE